MIRRSFNWLGNARADLSHMRSIESAARSDFDDLFSGVFSNGSSYVIKGLTLSATINAQADSIQLLVANSAIMHSASQTSGTILTIPSTFSAETLNPVTNAKVDGSFTPNSDNYIGLRYNRQVDDSTTDTVYFWDPTTKAEISKSVPLALILDYEIVITNTTQPANILPLARIKTNSTNGITEIEDRRNLLYRLGTAGTNPPNPAYVYPWSAGRNENPSTSTSISDPSPFIGGDKQLLSFKDWSDAIMSMLKEIKGTTYWYSPISGSGSIITIASDATKSIVTGTGVISHSAVTPGQINWNSDVFIKVVGTPIQYRIIGYTAGTDIQLSDEEVAYLNLQRGLAVSTPLTWTNGSAAVTGAVSWTDELTEGDFIKIAGTADNEYYEILTIDSATQVTLVQAFSGTTNVYNSEYAYGVYATTSTVFPAPPVTITADRRIQIDAKASVPFDQNVWWLFYRSDDSNPTALVYIHLNATQLGVGESTTISHGVSNQTLAFIGAVNDQDATPIYSTKSLTTTTTSGNQTVADTESLTASIKILDTETNTPLRMRASTTADQFLNFEDASVKAGDNANKTLPPIAGSVYFNTAGSVDFSAAQPVGTTASVSVEAIAPTNGDYYVAAAYLDRAGLIQIVFSAGDAVLANVENESVIGALFPKSGLPIGYALLQYIDGTDFWKSASSVSNTIVSTDIYRFGSGGGIGGSDSSPYNDDLISMLFRGKVTDEFSESSSDPISTVASTNAAFDTSKEMYVISYDASKTVTGTGTAMTLSAAPSFVSVAADLVGLMLIVGSEAKKIVGATTTTACTVESAFTVDPAAAACTVSEVINTKDLYGSAFDGVSLFDTFSGATFDEFMIDYEDSSAAGDNIFDITAAPVIAWSASGDNSTWTNIGVRPTLQTSIASSSFLPSADDEFYLRLFANKSSGSGTVNLLNYRAYMQKDGSATYGGLFSSLGTTDGSSTPVNCTIAVVGGKTRVTLSQVYPVGVNVGDPQGALDVYLNGQLIPRYISPTETTTSYYTEADSTTIDLDQDYSGFPNLEVAVVKRATVIDTATTNTTAIAELETVQNPRNYIDNGAMDIWERVGSGTVTVNTASVSSGLTADRFSYGSSGTAVKNYSIVRSTDVPTLLQTKFLSKYSYLFTMLTGNAMSNADDLVLPITQCVTYEDLRELMYKTVTIGFWVKASAIGTYTVAINTDLALLEWCYLTTFNVAVANTWEYKTVTIAQLPLINQFPASPIGMFVTIGACGGADATSGTTNTWFSPGADAKYVATGSTNWMANTNATLRVTQVSLTANQYGFAATDFKRKYIDFNSEFRNCRAFYQKSYGVDVVAGTVGNAGNITTRATGTSTTTDTVSFHIPMYVPPTVTLYNPTTGASGTFRDTTAGADRTTTAADINETSFVYSVTQPTDLNVLKGHWTAETGL